MTLDTPRALAPAERLRRLEDPGRDFPVLQRRAGRPVGVAVAVRHGGGGRRLCRAGGAHPLARRAARGHDPGRAVPVDSDGGAGAGRAGSLEGDLRQGGPARATADGRFRAAEHRRQHERRRHRPRPDRRHAQRGHRAAERHGHRWGASPSSPRPSRSCSAKRWSPCCPSWPCCTWLTNRFGVGRKGAIVGAWLISSLLFGLIHLPTYDWNLIQCIVVIGSARMVLTLPWILTKNIWVSTGAHIVNDWLLFSMSLLGAGLVGKV